MSLQSGNENCLAHREMERLSNQEGTLKYWDFKVLYSCRLSLSGVIFKSMNGLV